MEMWSLPIVRHLQARAWSIFGREVGSGRRTAWQPDTDPCLRASWLRPSTLVCVVVPGMVPRLMMACTSSQRQPPQPAPQDVVVTQVERPPPRGVEPVQEESANPLLSGRRGLTCRSGAVSPPPTDLVVVDHGDWRPGDAVLSVWR